MRPSRAFCLLLPFAALFSHASCDGSGSAPPAPPETLPSGLVRQVLTPGSGDEATDGRYVALHYEARIAAVAGVSRNDPPYDGTRAGEPFLAKLGKSPLLPGFFEGVLGMKEGERRRLTIPPALAYGALGKGAVPPDATLEYDVELVDAFTLAPSGLQYRIVAEGAGEPPNPGQQVVVHHRGWLLETGRELTSSKMTARTLDFVLGQGAALPGIEEAVAKMRRGARWIVAIPPALGYGPLGHGLLILPGQDVLFELELVGTRGG